MSADPLASESSRIQRCTLCCISRFALFNMLCSTTVTRHCRNGHPIWYIIKKHANASTLRLRRVHYGKIGAVARPRALLVALSSLPRVGRAQVVGHLADLGLDCPRIQGVHPWTCDPEHGLDSGRC